MTDRDEVRGVGEVALRAMYIDLLKQALTHTLYWPPDFSTDMPIPICSACFSELACPCASVMLL